MGRRHVMRIARLAVAESATDLSDASRSEQRESRSLAEIDAATLAHRTDGTVRAETSSSELNPNSTLPQSVSTPPTTAASARPMRISRSACANTFALDEQAVATVTLIPVESKRVLDEIADRVRSVNDRPPQILGIATIGIEPAVSLFAGADTRRRGSHDHRDTISTMAFASGERRVQESIRRQSTPGEPVVPAFPTRKMCW